MNKLQEKLIDSLKRMDFIFKNKEIHTKCVKKQKRISILGEKFGPYELGKMYRLKLFCAIPFIENDVLQVIPSEKCDNMDLQRFAITERDDSRLIQQEDTSFLEKIKEFRLFMKNDVMTGKKPQNFLDNYNSYFASVLDSRLIKILKMGKSELTLDDEKRLTHSEHLLFNIINEIIFTWRRFYLSLS